MSAKLQLMLRDLRARLGELYGDRLVHVVLFGSQARGDARPGWNSDIDVLVVLKGEVQVYVEIVRTGGIVAGLSLENDVAICLVFMDENYFNLREGPLLRNIREEGVIL